MPASIQWGATPHISLIDPRTTRQQRWAARGTESQRNETERATAATVSLENIQGTDVSGNCLHPVVDIHSSQFVNSFSAGPSEYSAVQSVGQSVPYMLEPGVGVSGGDFSLYSDQICNKRISYAGPEWSAGRPGHTPTRRILACGKLVEDSCAGQERSGDRAIGPLALGPPHVCLPRQHATQAPMAAHRSSRITRATTPGRSNHLLLHHHETDNPGSQPPVSSN